MINTSDDIAQALTLLTTLTGRLEQPPAMIVLPPDSGNFIIGNQGGFIRLAIASLKAALGEEQSFKKESWVSIEDLDWAVRGLKPDESAHIYLPAKKTKAHKVLASIWSFALLLVAYDPFDCWPHHHPP